MRTLLLLLICGCTPKTSTEVADKFVDLYFVEIDQKKALPLTSGLAHQKIEEELSLVADIRRSYEPEEPGTPHASGRPLVMSATIPSSTPTAPTISAITASVELEPPKDDTPSTTGAGVSELSGPVQSTTFPFE